MSGPTEINVANAALRRLLDETSDLIDSPAFTHVLTLLLDSAFSLLIDTKIATLAYKIPPPSASGARVVEIVGPGTDVKAKVASTLATFSRQAHSIGSGGNNEYLTAMENVRDLEAFAAVVYSSNFEFEAPEQAGLNASWEKLVIPCSESETVGETSTPAVTPAPSGPLKAKDPEEEVPGGEESLIGVGEVDMEKAWWKATASPSSSPSKAKKAQYKKEQLEEKQTREESPRQELRVPAPKEYVNVQGLEEEVPAEAAEEIKVDALKEDVQIEATSEEAEMEVDNHEAAAKIPQEQAKEELQGPMKEAMIESSKEQAKVDFPKEEAKAKAPKEKPKVEVKEEAKEEGTVDESTLKTPDLATFPSPPNIHAAFFTDAATRPVVPEAAVFEDSILKEGLGKDVPLEETAGVMPGN